MSIEDLKQGDMFVFVGSDSVWIKTSRQEGMAVELCSGNVSLLGWGVVERVMLSDGRGILYFYGRDGLCTFDTEHLFGRT